MTTQYLAQDIEREEGRVCEAYPDPLTKGYPYTIGCGHAAPEVHLGLIWTNEQIDAALAADIARAMRALDCDLPWWRGLDDVRQDVLVQMCFQLGIGRLEGFTKALAAMKARNWQEAHDEMLDSAWANQTPERAAREAKQMLTGVRSWA